MNEEIKVKKSKKKIVIFIFSIMIPLLASVLFMCSYGRVNSFVADVYENPFESENSVQNLFKGNYVLYRNLYEKNTGENVRYSDIYIKDMQAMLLVEDIEYTGEELKDITEGFNNVTKRILEETFLSYTKYFDYYAEDLATGVSVTNSTTGEPLLPQDYFYYIEVIYDENGNMTIANAKSENSNTLMKNAVECTLTKNQMFADWMEDTGFGNSYEFNYLIYSDGPKNCRIIYGMTENTWMNYRENAGFVLNDGRYTDIYYMYLNSGVSSWLLSAIFLVALIAFLLPAGLLLGKPIHKYRIFNFPFEVMILLGTLGLEFCFSIVPNSIVRLLTGAAAKDIVNLLGIPVTGANVIAYVLHALILFVTFLFGWYVGLCCITIREKKLIGYIKENSLIYRIFPFCKNKIVKVYDSLEHLDVTHNAKKTILKIVLLNATVLFFISCLWFGGLMVTVVYSLLLYFGLKFYVSRMQKKYTIMLEKVHEISEGNLNVEITEDLGIFNPFKDQLLDIQTGFRSAVEEEVKSQRLKSELITNVSHDLKTPLTAIITYVDLLKDENLTKEQQKEYLDTLERKSLRLKVLIEDLFEVSKATSGNITLNYMAVDLCNLVKQVAFEMTDKLAEKNLELRIDFPMEKEILKLDSQKTYRIYENLLLNIAKYSLPGTRVYIKGEKKEDTIEISLKNISATEITVDAAALTERFVRGDASRNTEGSGLGLAIVKSFVEIQGGHFYIENDGDLFKAITVFPCKR